MSELLLCQKEEITPVADAIRELCAVDEEMSLVSMRARITNAAAAMQEQNELIGQITEALGATPTTSTPSIEGNTELLKDLLDTAENSAGLLPELTNEGAAADLLAGKELIGSDGQIVTGTIETKTSTNVTLNSSTGVVSVPKGYYASAVSHTLPEAQTEISIMEDSGHAYAYITPTQKGFLKSTPVPTYIGEYSTNANHTFEDITSTAFNIPAGYVATESSVSIAPAVVSEVDEQTALIEQILAAVNDLPPQNPPAVILPEPEPEPVGELSFVLTTGTSVTMEQLTNIICSSGAVNQVKLGDEVLWEYDLIKDSEILFAPAVHEYTWEEEYNAGYFPYPLTLTREIKSGETLIVVINGTSYQATTSEYTYTDGRKCVEWESGDLYISTPYSETGIDNEVYVSSETNYGDSPIVEVYCID